MIQTSVCISQQASHDPWTEVVRKRNKSTIVTGKRPEELKQRLYSHRTVARHSRHLLTGQYPWNRTVIVLSSRGTVRWPRHGLRWLWDVILLLLLFLLTLFACFMFHLIFMQQNVNEKLKNEFWTQISAYFFRKPSAPWGCCAILLGIFRRPNGNCTYISRFTLYLHLIAQCLNIM